MIDIVFDIETAPGYPVLSDAPKPYRAAYHNHWIKSKGKGLSLEDHYNNSGLYPEFGKIVCISTVVVDTDETQSFYLNYESSEKQLLHDFGSYIASLPGKPRFIGHNIKGFDIPFLQTRMAHHGYGLPDAFKVYGKKPWEVDSMVDTLEAWRQFKYSGRSKVSDLGTICMVLGVPTPKDGISGKDVGKVFYEGGIEDIVAYCEKDVHATKEVYLKLISLNFI